MSSPDSIERLRELSTRSLLEHMPARCEPGWIRALVDPPRFGWDEETLNAGFFAPMHEWALGHPTRLRPVFAALLIEAMGGASEEQGAVLAALEVHYLASVMLDALRNGNDIRSTAVESVAIPVPVWVTVAYNARQLAPVIVARGAAGLREEPRARLALAFSQILFRQGLGSASDLRASETGTRHQDPWELAHHVRLYLGPSTFGLACEAAACAVGFDPEKTARLADAGRDLGTAARLAALARGADASLPFAGRTSTEQQLRWTAGVAPEATAPVVGALRERALEAAGGVHPGAANAFALLARQLEVDEEGQP